MYLKFHLHSLFLYNACIMCTVRNSNNVAIREDQKYKKQELNLINSQVQKESDNVSKKRKSIEIFGQDNPEVDIDLIRLSPN